MMIKYVAAVGVASFLAFAISGTPASGQVVTPYPPPVTLYSPPVPVLQPVAPPIVVARPRIGPVQDRYDVFSPPIVTSRYGVTPRYGVLSPPVVTTPVGRPSQTSYSVPLTGPSVAVPVVTPPLQPVVVRPKIYVPGQPVRNALRAVTP